MLIRVLATAGVTLTHVFFVDEVATAPTGTLTAVVKRLDGTSIVGSPFTYTVTGTSCSFTLPGQDLVDSLTLDWNGTVGGEPVTVRDHIEIVGGFLFNLGDARHQLGLDANTYPTSLLAAKRTEIEQEFEKICHQAFVPRFSRRSLTGRDTPRLGTPDMMLRGVRAATVAGTVLDAPALAAITVSDHGILTREAGWSGAVTVEYEHGRDYPPSEISTAGILRLQSRLGMVNSAIPTSAISFTVAEGGVYRLSTPSKQRTGQPAVDGVLERYTLMRRPAFA